MVAGADTSMGGPGRAFPTTLWSDIVAAADPADPSHRERLDKLLRAYWKPVFAYVRAAWHKNIEDAKDLTQAFFCHLLGKEFARRVAPGAGSFRAYLKRALRNFVIDAKRTQDAHRPDGPVFSLEAHAGEMDRLGPAASDESPDRAYDRVWFRVVLDAAVEDLREELVREGKENYFEVFRLYCLSTDAPAVAGPEPAESPTYDDLAARLGLKRTDVRNFLMRCRQRLRERVRERIREYAEGTSDVEQELKLFLEG